MDVIPKVLRYGCYTKVSAVWMLYQGLRGKAVIPRALRYGSYTKVSEVWILYQKPPEVWMLYEEL